MSDNTITWVDFTKYVEDSGELKLQALKMEFKRAFREDMVQTVKFACAKSLQCAARDNARAEALRQATVQELIDFCRGKAWVRRELELVTHDSVRLYGDAELAQKVMADECKRLSDAMRTCMPQRRDRSLGTCIRRVLRVELHEVHSRCWDLDSGMCGVLFAMMHLVPTVWPECAYAVGDNLYARRAAGAELFLRDLVTPLFGASLSDLYVDRMSNRTKARMHECLTDAARCPHPHSLLADVSWRFSALRIVP